MTAQPCILSFGAGVQSHALLAMMATGRYPGDRVPDEVWFCDPLNERPQTYEFLERVTKPFCAAQGITFLTLHRAQGKVRGPDLLESYKARLEYPLRRNRECTVDWKIEVMLAECKRRHLNRCVHGVRVPSVDAQIKARKKGKERLVASCAACPGGAARAVGVIKHLGISTDEIHRATSAFGEDWETKHYPLVDARIFRRDCVALCKEVFGEVPVKSGCWFCKFMSRAQWREVWEQRHDNGNWERAVDWERVVVEAHSRAACFISIRRKGVRNHTLPEWGAIWEQGTQPPLAWGDADAEQAGACDGGYCMT